MVARPDCRETHKLTCAVSQQDRHISTDKEWKKKQPPPQKSPPRTYKTKSKNRRKVEIVTMHIYNSIYMCIHISSSTCSLMGACTPL